MFRGTTPTYIFKTPSSVDLTQATKVYVTFAKTNGTLIMTKTDEDLEISSTQVEVYLTQEETLSFPNGQVEIQLNWLYQVGDKVKRATSTKMLITAEQNLLNEVLS